MDQEIRKELQEIEEMVREAQKHEEYTEKYFILREGLIKLAGGFAQAALLSSLIGWTRHWLKTDNEIYKQIKAAAEVGDIEKIRRLKHQIRQGWFWKSAREMAEELLNQVSEKTCERYVKKFEEMGLISSRDPDEKATYRAKWYKANIEKIKEELEKMGYQLDYYKDLKNSIRQNVESQKQGISEAKTAKPLMYGIRQNDESHAQAFSEPQTSKPLISGIRQNDGSSGQNVESPRQNVEYLLYKSFNISSSNTEGDDDRFVDSKPWESDVKYIVFRQLFTEAGADDIVDHQKHYPKFKECLDAVGYARLIVFAEKYIAENKENSQICWFIGGGWKNYLPKKATKKAIGQAGKLPQAVAQQLEAEKEQAAGSTLSEEERAERRARIQAKLKRCDESLSARFGDPFAVNPLHSQK